MLHSPRGVEYERLGIIVNPKSRRARGTQRYIEKLKTDRFGNALYVMETPSACVDDTIDMLGNNVRKGDVIGIAGGDGTLNLVVEALLKRRQATQRQQRPPRILPRYITNSVVLPLWRGSMNDGANSLNPQRWKNKPDKILAQGHKVRIRPLKFQFQEPAQERIPTRLSVLYGSLGITARTAQGINLRRDEALTDNALHNWVADRMLAYRCIRQSKPFAVLGDEIDGEYTELLFSNGPRMAGTFRPSVHIDVPEWRLTALRSNDLPALLPTMGRLMCGRPVGEPRGEGTENDTVSFMTQTEVLAEFDGDTAVIPPHTFITVGTHPDGFNAIMTK